MPSLKWSPKKRMLKSKKKRHYSRKSSRNPMKVKKSLILMHSQNLKWKKIQMRRRRKKMKIQLIQLKHSPRNRIRLIIRKMKKKWKKKSNQR